MRVFDLRREQEWDPKHHVEKILDRIGAGDVSVACWEPGQVSRYHCHPEATEIYLCFEGGGKMRTPSETIDMPGELTPCSGRLTQTEKNTTTSPQPAGALPGGRHLGGASS